MQEWTSYGDETLVQMIAVDDRAAFNTLYERYWDRLYATAYHHLKDTGSAEELVQDVFITIWQKRQELSINNVSVYLAAMVRYAVYRKLAREKQRSELHQAAGAFWPVLTEPRTLDHKQLLELIDKISSELPEKCRLVFRANKLHDQPLQEVAQALNISQKTAEAHLTKALKLIRLNLGKAFHSFFTLF